MLTEKNSIPETTIPHCDPLLDGISSVSLVRVSGSDLDIVNAARVSFGKVATTVSERDKNLIKYLIEHDHTSPFEHNQFSFRIKAPLFVTRQWMRHRMNSYNEISYRYVKAPLEFYIPPHWRHQDATNRQCSTGSFSTTPFLPPTKKVLMRQSRRTSFYLKKALHVNKRVDYCHCAPILNSFLRVICTR